MVTVVADVMEAKNMTRFVMKDILNYVATDKLIVIEWAKT